MSLFCPEELGSGLWPLTQGQRHGRWTPSIISASIDLAVNPGEEKLGKTDPVLTCGRGFSPTHKGDKTALRAVGDSSPMAELPCFRNFWLCCACRPEK
ncbi:hypothetical protein Taro_019535 [Colocasia esculenta]|uniref:Uncharacterized protein n=1 Tax=Colocasia esculenta TaxID=4460 RepID=A0A843UU15_COLES|nr:hypothetical protein [Colocasia esculenta]